jgi:hypothetical protein
MRATILRAAIAGPGDDDGASYDGFVVGLDIQVTGSGKGTNVDLSG